MEKIKVLHVFGIMNRGGAETLAMNFLRKINKNHFHFDFIVHTQKEGDYDKEILESGSSIYNVPRFNGFNYFKYKKAWENFFKNHKYDIIHAHMTSTSAIFLKIARKHGIKTIAHSHSESDGKNFIGKIKQMIQKKVIKYTDYPIACSKNAGVYLFGNNNNFQIINNAINLDDFKFNEEIRKKVRLDLNIENKTIIGHVGRFVPVKNHNFIVDVFNEYLKKNPQSVLVLVGSGQLLQEIKEKVKNLNLDDKVLFTGTRSDVNELLMAMDCLIFPSFWEGLPVTLVEAQATGLTILGSDKISNETFITPNIKAISLDKDAKFWADQITLNFERNFNYIEDKISKFDINKETIKLEKIYNDLLKR